MREVYATDEQGYLIEVRLEDESNTDYITVAPPSDMYRPKWTGKEWVAGEIRPKTQLEILQETVDMLVLDNLGVL
jgi:hypothetical protein